MLFSKKAREEVDKWVNFCVNEAKTTQFIILNVSKGMSRAKRIEFQKIMAERGFSAVDVKDKNLTKFFVEPLEN